MKNKILLLAFMLMLIFSTGFAQSFKAGVKGGVDMNKIDGKPFTEQFTYGYHLGAFAQIGLGTKWGIQPELLFSQVNVDSSENFSDVYKFKSFSNIDLKYIKIPLLLNFSPNPFVTLQAGPQFGILLDQESNLLENGKNAFSKGDFSMLAGIQLNISRVKIYGRYAVGLNNLNDIDKQDKWNSQNVEIGVGFTIL